MADLKASNESKSVWLLEHVVGGRNTKQKMKKGRIMKEFAIVVAQMMVNWFTQKSIY